MNYLIKLSHFYPPIQPIRPFLLFTRGHVSLYVVHTTVTQNDKTLYCSETGDFCVSFKTSFRLVLYCTVYEHCHNCFKMNLIVSLLKGYKHMNKRTELKQVQKC